MSSQYQSHYRPESPFFLNGHIETIYPSLFRKTLEPSLKRERIDTPDDDFLDLDWSKIGSNRLLILNHGLEGNSTRPYMLGMINVFNDNGWDVLSWNFRSCSEDINRQSIFYHSGATNDLDTVVQHAEKTYEKIALLGFSLGGNLLLKYLGERGHSLSHKIKAGIAFSVPMHLEDSCYKIMDSLNFIYERRFLNKLKAKVKLKSDLYPGLFDLKALEEVKKLIQFDDLVTAPIHGFKSAKDYYTKCSSLYFVSDIAIPTLIVNAENDPMISKSSFPMEMLKKHPVVQFEKWKHGGHVGFWTKDGLYASEKKALRFLNEIIN